VGKREEIHQQLKAEQNGGPGVPGGASNGASKVGPGAGAEPGFVHLHAQSSYSLLESALPLEKMIALAVGDKQPALAVTDRNNLFGALEFSEKAAANGLQPIMGITISVDFNDLAEPENGSRKQSFAELPAIVLLAANQAGYENLVKLASLAHLGEMAGEDGALPVEGQEARPADQDVSASVESVKDGGSGKGNPNTGENITSIQGIGGHGQAGAGQDRNAAQYGPHISFAALVAGKEGLICLTGGSEGPIDLALQQGQGDLARERLLRLKAVFDNRLYVEVQRHGTMDDPREQVYENQLLRLAYDNELPLVATNQPYFATRSDYPAHDALLCIAAGVVVGSDDRRALNEEYYFKSRSEMVKLFADLPEALENTVEIARRCAFRSPTRGPILPRFASVDGKDGAANDEDALKAEADLLRSQSVDGLARRLESFDPASGFTRKDYEDRLDFELGVINQMGFPGYFLIVADFIRWAKDCGIPVGPGRGSGAGSLVAWALTITDIDPMRFSLLFERFLNPERVSMPDFDIDFCQDRREEVIRYVQQKYGREQVAQIITFGTLQARAVLRDVGRVLQMPYSQVDRIAKLVPSNPANPVSLKQAIDGEPKLQEARNSEEIVGRLFDISTRLEGLYRHASTHAAGIVIGDRKLDRLVPLYRDPRSEMPVTQFNMKWVEPAGLVKFDFLGLKTLTVLELAVKFVRERKENPEDIDLQAIPLDDPQTFEMLTKGETIGVFQLESAGMRKALVGMKPDRFEDIIALVALYRPGPMENIPVYNARKHGKEERESIHPKIDHLVAETQGVIVYQEQVMQIAQELAGYSLGEADILRRAMGKKIRAEMDKQRGVFVDGAVERGLSKSKANEIFDLLAKFADYGFNKSHAAAYALVSYQTAYMKARYPVEFLAASMQLDMGNTDKLAIFRQEAKALGIEVVAPSVQTSKVSFSVADGRIFYALAAIKGVGEGAVAQIVSSRSEQGEYASLGDFFNRLDIKQVNKRTIESLISAGALDCFGHSREQLLAGMDRLLGHASILARERETGQDNLFGEASNEDDAIELPNVKPWSPSERLQKEFQAMGFYLSAHPLDEYRELMLRDRVQQYGEFEKSVRAGATAGRLAGTIISKQERNTRSGKRMGIVTLSDPSGQYEAVIFEEGLGRFREMLEPGNSVVLLVGAESREEGVSVRIQSVEALEEKASRITRDLRIFLRDDKALDGISNMLNGKSAPPRGDGRVSMVVIQGNGEMEVEVSLRNKFKMTPQFANAIKSVPGVLEVELV